MSMDMMSFIGIWALWVINILSYSSIFSALSSTVTYAPPSFFEERNAVRRSGCRRQIPGKVRHPVPRDYRLRGGTETVKLQKPQNRREER